MLVQFLAKKVKVVIKKQEEKAWSIKLLKGIFEQS